jgi:DNA polymerase/3'-5' exonuclease PolX
MDLTYEELHAKTVAELRDISSELEHDSLHGYSTMHKEQLLSALCGASRSRA